MSTQTPEVMEMPNPNTHEGFVPGDVATAESEKAWDATMNPKGDYTPVKINAPTVGEQNVVPVDHQLGQHAEG